VADVTAPRVELLYWDGCPSHPQALSELREALEALGYGHLAVSPKRIEDDREAETMAFVGSPTIRVDGTDAFPPGADEPYGLACRVYRLADGRFSPTPDPGRLRERLASLLARRE
jgi:hypothetical protein